MGMHTIVSLVNMAAANKRTEAAHQRVALAHLELEAPDRAEPLSRNCRNAISAPKKNTPPSPSTQLLPIQATLSTLEGCSPNSNAVSPASRTSRNSLHPKTKASATTARGSKIALR